MSTIQTFSRNELIQFKALTKVYKDDSTPQGGRPSNFIRLRIPWNLPTSTSESDAQSETLGYRSGALEVVDAPEVNKRPVTSRIVHVVPCTSGDPRKLVKSMGYDLAYSYFEQGYELKIGSITVRVHQIFKAEGTRSGDSSQVREGDDAEDADLQGLSIGDGTTWIVQADVDIQPGQSDELRRGTDDLLRFKRDVQGLVDLSVLVDELR